MKKQQQTAFLLKANKDLEGAKSEQSYKKKILDLVAVGVKASEMITALETDVNSDVLKARFNVVRSKLKMEEKAKALVSAITLDPDATHESAFGTKERTAPSKASEKSADVRKAAKLVCELMADNGENTSITGLFNNIARIYETSNTPLEKALDAIFIKVGDCLRTGAMRNEWDAAKTAAKDAKAKAKDDAKAKAKDAKANKLALEKEYDARDAKVAKAKAKAETSKANRKLATKSQLAKAKGKKQKVTK